MINYKEVEGDLIALALEGTFDVVVHGCNCFCTMGAGIAPQMAKTFGCDSFQLESEEFKGDVNKLGCIDFEFFDIPGKKRIYPVNAYTQYGTGTNYLTGSPVALDYEALVLCMRKINKIFKGKHIGLPLIGCGLAGGEWKKVKKIFQNELKDCTITVVHYKAK